MDTPSPIPADPTPAELLADVSEAQQEIEELAKLIDAACAHGAKSPHAIVREFAKAVRELVRGFVRVVGAFVRTGGATK